MMIVSGIRVQGTSSGLANANGLVSAITPWFWVAVAGQVILFLSKGSLQIFEDFKNEISKFASAKKLVVSALRVLGIAPIVLGLSRAWIASTGGNDIEFAPASIEWTWVIAGLFVLIISFFVQRNWKNHD